MQKREIVLLGMLLVSLSCSAQPNSKDVKKQFMVLYSMAIAGDEQSVDDALKYLNTNREAIEKEHVVNIYYIEAQLLMKKRQGVKALEVMLNSKNKLKGVYLASLYYKLGDKDSAEKVLDSDYAVLVEAMEQKNSKERKKYLDTISLMLFMRVNLSLKEPFEMTSFSPAERKYVDEKLIELGKNDMIASMWP
jgi:hypothetical protein